MDIAIYRCLITAIVVIGAFAHVAPKYAEHYGEVAEQSRARTQYPG